MLMSGLYCQLVFLLALYIAQLPHTLLSYIVTDSIETSRKSLRRYDLKALMDLATILGAPKAILATTFYRPCRR